MRSKHNSKRIRTLRRRRLALALVTAMAAPMAWAQSLPDTGTVTSGSATINNSGNDLTITQTTKGAIIDWGSFNIGAGYGVTFDQQFGTSSVTLNRVIGFGYSSSPSFIDGTLSSNGNVFIINPSGIVFGSGAQVNVGGLVASTLAISDADFQSGVSSGKYRFTSNGSTAGAVTNNGQLTAATGGTIGLIGSQINNAGTISTTNGSVVFGATNQVTLDYFGDGLTQVTVSGNGLGVSNCSLNCNGGITSSGNVYALGGHIEMRSNTMDGQSAGNGLFVDPANGGRVWIGGTVSATTSGTRRGSVIIDAGLGNIDLGGVGGRTGNVSANASNAGENGGTVELRGNQLFTHLCYGNGPADLCVANNRLGLVMASAFGTGGSAGEIHIDVNRFYHGGVLVAVANDGSGGLIDINAGSAEIYNRIFAYGNNGAGGTININADNLLLFRGQQPWLGGPGTAYWSASLLAYGTTTGGAVNIDAGSLVVTDLGNVIPQNDDVAPVINVTGQLGGNGGTININAGYASIGDTWFANASGDGLGGSITITGDSIDLEGGLVATGTSGGSVTTTTTGSMFVGPTAYVDASTWLVHAPSVQIVPASGAVSGYGAVLTDDALSATLDGGTLVQLYADAALVSGGTGNIHIDSGVNIVHATGDAAALEMRATAGIYGSYFDIQSTGGPLDLSFTANVHGDDPDHGYVSFFNIGLSSNGGDITMSGDGSGVYLEYSQISSGAGDILINGYGDENGVQLMQASLTSAGGDISIDASSAYGAGARLENADINSGGGNIAIDANGPDGVWVVYSDLTSVGGDISIDGTGIYSGSYFHDSIIDSADGNIAITGTASLDAAGYYPFGVALAGTTLSSTTGDISVVGDAVGGSGIEFWTSGSLAPGITTTSGAIALTSTGANGFGLEGLDIATDTGDITIFGSASSASATAGVFVGSSGLHTNGGDINITGSTAGGSGVFLYYGDLSSNGGDISVLGQGFYYGVHVLGSLVSSGTGDISITGTAVGSGSITSGVDVLDGTFTSTSGAIAIKGSAALGAGVSFRSTGSGPGSSVTTTSGAISVISAGLSGLNVADVPFSTDTGDITLEGTATGSDFGIYVGAGGLSTNGGDITLIGSSVDRTGVLVYNGDLTSHGGDITIVGSSTNLVGVQVSGNDIDSGGGNISINGQGASTGLIVAAARIYSGAGDISLAGIGGGNGAGVGIGQGSVITTTSGDVLINGVSDTYDGILLNTGDVHTTAGDITMIGEGGNVGVNLQHGNLGTATGGIDINGTGGAIGIHIGDTDVVSTSGGIGMAGLGGNGAGFMIDNDSSIDGGTGLVALGAGNDGSSDAIILQGRISSAKAVNLRPFNVNSQILLGAGNGFSLISSDLAMIDAPLLVIGSAQHAGAINVAQAVDWDGNLTLQNQGGNGGIDIQAALDVGDHTLALASGGNISQAATGGISAHSLLAIAGGNVALTTAANNVAASSLAGSAGGDFAYEDVDSLAIGDVSSFGYSPVGNMGLISLSATGIAADGNVLVRTASGDLFLGADVSGSSINLVAADIFHNPDGATLSASNGWRIWARTWDGEERGGLQGDGFFDVFGCTFGAQGCTGLSQGNQFIYQERRLVQAPIAPETVAEWFDEDDQDGAIDLLQAAICPVADTGELLQVRESKDELASQWLKSRHRLRLSNCIDNKSAPGCKF